MILILSEKDDYSTDLVVDWLEFFKKKWFRVNRGDLLHFSFVDSKPFFVLIDKEIPIDEISSIWYRRKSLTFNNNVKSSFFQNIINEEHHWYSDYIRFLLNDKKAIGSNESINVNKLIALSIAEEVGLKVPKSMITGNINDLDDATYITKTIAGNGSVNIDSKFSTYSYTEIVKKEDVEEPIATSFFQELVDKKYELRIFFMHNEFWCMAIFSQLDDTTKLDFRRYNNEKPNRNVPYNLPVPIKEKIILLMRKLNINCGSIDMIVTTEDEFIFLEVNPVGQIGMTSGPCNYNLEKEIALFL